MGKKAVIKERIIEEAVNLISEKGIVGTTLAEISKNVDISKGTLYYYYSSKNDLIYDITRMHMDHLTNSLFEIIKQNKGQVKWQEMLKKLIVKVIGSDTRTRLHIYLLQEILLGNEKLKNQFTGTYEKWFDMISEAYTLITEKQNGIKTEARIFVAAIDGLVIQNIIGTGSVPFDEIVKKLSIIIGE